MKTGNRPASLHISWQIASICFGSVIGIALSALISLDFASSSAWLAASLTLAILGFSKHSTRFALLTVIAGLCLGMWRGSGEQQALSMYVPYMNSAVSIKGKVNEDISHGERGDTRLQLAHVTIDGHAMDGKVWISADTTRPLKRSDTVTFSGKLKEGFGNIPASMSGATLVSVQPTSKTDYALTIRDWFANGIRKAIPDPQASLGSGFLTGQHSDLPGDLDDQLRIVGLTHAVVASGSNLTILVGFMRRSLLRVSKYTATLAGSLMTIGFVLVAGMSPSMTRAGLVTGLSLAAWYYGRRINPLVLLALAAGVTTMYNPSYVWGDLGWYLSFGAFLGVLVVAPLMQHYFWGRDYEPGVMMETFIGTIAAQVTTMPVILFSFGTFSSYALLANMLVVPLIPFAMLLTFAAGISGVLLPGCALIIGWPATIVMKYMTIVIDKTASLPGAQAEFSYGIVALLTSYCLMIAVIIYIQRVTNHAFGSDKSILIGERP
jgi:competence protein ComEC